MRTTPVTDDHQGVPAGEEALAASPRERRSGVAVVDRQTGTVRRSRTVTPAPDALDKATGVGGGRSDRSDDSTDPVRAEAEADVDAEAEVDDAGGTNAGDVRREVEPGSRRRRVRSTRVRRAVPWTLAVLGLSGTLIFGHAWANQNAQSAQQTQVRAVAGDFLLALTNFDAKDVDADFNQIQGYATGDFAKQSNQFFGSAIRQQLEAALASSRGQIRSQYVQSIGGNQASVYSVVDQTYVNNKMSSPAADELQIQTDLTKVGGVWKIGNVTVLNNNGGATAGTTGTAGATGTSATGG